MANTDQGTSHDCLVLILAPDAATARAPPRRSTPACWPESLDSWCSVVGHRQACLGHGSRHRRVRRATVHPIQARPPIPFLQIHPSTRPNSRIPSFPLVFPVHSICCFLHSASVHFHLNGRPHPTSTPASTTLPGHRQESGSTAPTRPVIGHPHPLARHVHGGDHLSATGTPVDGVPPH